MRQPDPADPADPPDPPDQPAKRIWNSGPYDVIARAIPEQLPQIAGGAPEVESLWVRAVRRDVGSFITEAEREWWLIIDVGNVIVVTLSDVDGMRLGSRDDLELVYDRTTQLPHRLHPIQPPARTPRRANRLKTPRKPRMNKRREELKHKMVIAFLAIRVNWRQN